MNEFPSNIKFKYPWRKYQKRVLDDLNNQLNDNHLHIIAPPGSGKTVLGLEVVLRINKPALILAPTLTIRNQWIQRFCELFLQVEFPPDWISQDIRNPKFLTIVTYQGLHSACTDRTLVEEIESEEEIEEENNQKFSNQKFESILSGLKDRNIKTLVLDEAHHLKSEWWHTLTQLKLHLKPVIVGLTATPPYDVSPNEYQRYLDLNGPIDTEISVPELLIEDDLCPHQDYVLLSLPSDYEQKRLDEHRKNIHHLFDEIKNDEVLINYLQKLSIWIEPENNLEWIYANLSFYSAVIIFLNSIGIQISKRHLKVIGEKNINIPELNYEWIETLLDFYIYSEEEFLSNSKEHRINLENKLKRYGVIERQKILFTQNKKLSNLLIASISKLNSIKEIVDFEFNQLKHDLRLVILTDYIRKEFLQNKNESENILNKIGVVPIFEMLKRKNPGGIKIGVLTGSLIILPYSAYQNFTDELKHHGEQKFDLLIMPLNDDYFYIDFSARIDNLIVGIVTHLFQNGSIEVLIGTKSLLGEGWDAPAINSLILASFVGSFVLSNQMRGRAIRTQYNKKDKTANIWHLVCVDPSTKDGGEDYSLMKRRFNGFVGVTFKNSNTIENGIYRMNLPDSFSNPNEIEKKNQETYKIASDRKSLRERWLEALKNGVLLVEEIKVPYKEKIDYKTAKKLYFNKTIAYLISMLGSGILLYISEVGRLFENSVRNIDSFEELFRFLLVIGLIGIVLFAGLSFKTFKLYLKYRDISKDFQNIAQVVLKSLLKANAIKTDKDSLNVKSSVDDSGAVYCHLEGGTTLEKSIFINALKEVINPVINPRYLIIRKNKLLMFVSQKDYHSVPELIGRNKSLAEYFYYQWLLLVGSADLVYARSIEGRKILLRSRLNSLAAQFQKKVEYISKWR